MPLDKSKSKKAVSKNIETEQNAGKPHDQAVAIALHTAHPNEKGYSDGGIIDTIMGLMGKKTTPLETDKKEAMSADNIDPVVTSSSGTASGYAQGGLVQEDPPDAFYKQVGDATSEGMNHDLDAVKEFLMQMYNSDQVQNGNPDMSPTLGTDDTGLQGLANKAAGTPSNAPARGYADGGVVDPNEITDTSSIDALAGVKNQPPPIQFNPNAGLPPAPPQAPVQAPNTAVSDYIAQQKGALGQYGPEQQTAVSKAILGQQNGLGGRLANAGAGLGDAIVQGVARAGNPGFQQNLQNRQNTQAEMQLNALKGAREANVQNVEAGQKLDAMDPNSKLSKASQQSNGLFLSALGFDPKTISMMSAAQIPEAISTIKDLGIKDRELAVAKFKAQIEANALAETSRHNVAEEKNKGKEIIETAKQHGQENALKGQEIQSGQLEKLSAEPITSRLSNLVGLNPAQTSLEKSAGVKPVSLQNILPHPQDDQAIAWANAHPNDPRAVQIKRLHGIQ